MFFIGIFGVEQGQKQIGCYNNVICSSCGAFTRYQIFKGYSYFHIFFIPAFKWNTKYYVKSDCCGSINELDPSLGSEYERGLSPEIRSEHLRPVYAGPACGICANCGAKVDAGFRFCPRCGKGL